MFWGEGGEEGSGAVTASSPSLLLPTCRKQGRGDGPCRRTEPPGCVRRCCRFSSAHVDHPRDTDDRQVTAPSNEFPGKCYDPLWHLEGRRHAHRHCHGRGTSVFHHSIPSVMGSLGQWAGQGDDSSNCRRHDQAARWGEVLVGSG